MFDLTGKTALVTGAAGGIGASIAKSLHGAGATVALSGRQVDKLNALATELGSRAVVVPCDLADRAQVGKLIEEAIKALGGRLDILVNNAGLTRDNLFMVMKDEQWDEVIAVNLTSTFMLCRAATRAMLRNKSGYGRIINISSVSGIFGNPGQGKADRGDHQDDPRAALRHARRDRRRGPLSCQCRSRLHHRPDPPREWRDGHGLT